MKRTMRGAALPETALVLSLALIVLFGTSQMAIVAFTQASADGAAFLGAHALAIDPSASATSVIGSVFPQFSSGNIGTPGSTTNYQSQTISKTVDGFPLQHLSSAYTITGSDIELKPQGAAQAPQAFSFGATSTSLVNFCNPTKTCNAPSSRSIWLAQSVDTSGNGNGWNGPFKEWRCHQQYFASLNFPSSRPSGGLAASGFDWTASGTTENTIYGWDSGNHACS